MLYDHETDHACNHTPQCSPEQPTNLRAHAYFRTPTSTFPLSYRDGKQEKKSSKATFIIMVISYGRYSHRRQFVLLLELNTQPCDKRYNEIFNRGLHLSVWQRKKKRFSWGTMNCYLFPFEFSKGCPTQLWNNFTLFKCISFELKQ